MKLYDLERSGNCYKIRLFLSILDIDYKKIPVDVNAKENSSKEFLAMNPNGLVPVLVEDSTTVYDSAAILSYLARKYAEDIWFPAEPVQFAQVIRWLVFEQNEGRYGLARARAVALNIQSRFAISGNLKESQAIGTLALQILEKQLTQTSWLAGGNHATVCDIACYPYTAMCSQGGLSLEPYPAVNNWIKRIENLDGYVPLPMLNTA